MMEGALNEACGDLFHSVETLVSLTGISRREITVYCKAGLLQPARGSADDNEALFDDEAIYRIRRIEQLRVEQGINLAGIRLIFELMNEVRRLQEEMRFLR
jgi:DNA-binding transcriptional MerR regulator